ncbi:MAG: GNAT family N-acetyltransferase, partial [Rhodospirillales bacterium]|nr:GNAT family N-acetyltransferase [Rhodospirillales bacterium]
GVAAEATAGYRARRAVIRAGGRAIGLVQALERQVFGFFRIVEITRGPLWLPDAPDDTRQDGLRAIRQEFRPGLQRLPLWMPEMTDDPAAHKALRALGLRQVVTGYSSAWLDLGPAAEERRAALDGKWRNALRRAEKSRLTVRTTQGGRALDWLLAQHDTFRRARRFRASSGRFVHAFIAATRGKSNVVIATAMLGSEPVAGALFLGHGRAATYYVGWSGPEGRRLFAQNLALWRGIEALREAGFAALDLGGIDTRRAAGVARFKLGLGCAPYTLAGTWL